ncbi:unnamed protein product, partial [Adineta steineri]
VLADYVLTEPINSSPCNEKYTFVNLIIERLAESELSIDINDLFFTIFLFRHAVQLSHQSPIWLQIATISSDSIRLLIQSYKNNIELMRSNYLQLLRMIECLILANRYDDACLLFTKLIIPNLCSIDLEILLHKIIELCPKVENRDLFSSEILSPFVWELVDLQVKKSFALVYFDLIVAILKLYNDKAPDLCYRLLKRKD